MRSRILMMGVLFIAVTFVCISEGMAAPKSELERCNVVANQAMGPNEIDFLDDFGVVNSPLEQIDEIIAFFILAVEDETLAGVGPGKSASNRLKAFLNKLLQARTLIVSEDYDGASQQVMSALKKTDGEMRPPDFVDGSAAQTLADMLRELAGPDSYLVVDLSAGPSASSYPVSTLNAVPSGGWTDEYKTTKMVFRRIPAGAFTMGSPASELGRYIDEPQHEVTLTQDFYIGVFEVTQKQWERVMGTWPSYYNNASYCDSRPVEQVSYEAIRGSSAGAGWPANGNVDADTFMGRLRSRTGKAFDLPTESQWEYAGRAGTITALNSGYNLTSTSSDARMDEVGRYWFNGGNRAFHEGAAPSAGTATVGTYLANAWGLYDMHGNVWEWCLDWYGTYPGTVTDPKGAASGSDRVRRGGSWRYGASYSRVAYRGDPPPAYASFNLGFRAVLPPGQ
jgi:formylglycine-generating enzyme required for sulfatase activity